MKDFLFIRPDIIVTQGIRRALLADLSRGLHYFIPNSMATFIQRCNKRSLTAIYAAFHAAEHETIKEYLDWLIIENIGIITDNIGFVKNAGQIRTDWQSPYPITNCILEIGEKNSKLIPKLITSLSELRVPYVEVRIFEQLSFNTVLDLITKVQESDIKALTLIIAHTNEWTIKNIRTALQYFTVINTITLFAAPINQQRKIHDGTTLVNYTTETLSNCSCGRVSPTYFYPNIEFYAESIQFNSCLNRKIAIDVNGEIKNCPSMKKSYGNIKETALATVIEQPDFQLLWNITKHKIAVCQNCEFRDICQDCRAYLQQPDDIHSKPLKCGYDPSTTKWQDWSRHPYNQKAIQAYGLQHSS